MSEHGINATYKAGKDYDEAWVTIGADDPETWLARNQAFRDYISQAAAETAAEFRASNVAVRQLGAKTFTNLDGNEYQAPAQQVPQGVTHAPAQPVQQQAAPLQAVQGGLPAGVTIGTGPQADNPQYEELFIGGLSFKMAQALGNEIKGPNGHKFRSGKSSFLKFNGKDSPHTTSTQNETLVRNFIAANAHLQNAH